MPSVDYHFLYIDASLEVDWFFVAARNYWERFRPTVVVNLDLVALIPARKSVAITALCRRDIAPHIADIVKKAAPRAFYDPLVYDYVDEMQMTLDGRADLAQRFGVPEPAAATPTGKAG